MKTDNPTPIKIIDNKDVAFATSGPEHNFTCNTCIHYGLPTPIEDTNEVRRDITDEELALVIKVNPVHMGYCTRAMSTYGILLVNVPSTYCCSLYKLKHPLEQFEDDYIGDI